MVAAIYRHSQLQRRRQSVAGLLGGNGISNGGRSGLRRKREPSELSLTERNPTAESATSRLYSVPQSQNTMVLTEYYYGAIAKVDSKTKSGFKNGTPMGTKTRIDNGIMVDGKHERTRSESARVEPRAKSVLQRNIIVTLRRKSSPAVI
ncbi:hypothetical protein EVAR_73976_1 [Eumeta japonica]|uniref:Uncharacterized protein n=1 Tax=Eumeta variegata TaxID=151549 RepID=A0A4C1SVZ9_EUMVA|nr:hypothetical protein EVAR_73976_1 [Eumeta japonica]